MSLDAAVADVGGTGYDSTIVVTRENRGNPV